MPVHRPEDKKKPGMKKKPAFPGAAKPFAPKKKK